MWAWLCSVWEWLVALFTQAEPTLPPALAAFLAGQSVRQATYFNQGSDPALMRARDWPSAVHTTERLIRQYIDEQADTITRLEARCAALEIELMRQAVAQQPEGEGLIDRVAIWFRGLLD